MMNIRKTLIFSVILFSFIACEKNKRHPLTEVDVQVYLNINNAENTDLRYPTGSRIVTGGVNGIVIFRKSDGATNESFAAYDLTCPYEEEENCVVEIDGAVGTCPCCDSQFSLWDGSVTDGPSEWPLKSYYISFDGTYIYVSN